MFGPVSYKDPPIELCYSNCPRVYPAGVDGKELPSSTERKSVEVPPPQLPVEYRSDVGRRIYAERLKPCYLFIRLTRPHCRSLRNFIITNSTKLSVVKGEYCGISPKVFNTKLNSIEPTVSLGLLRFATTGQAFRFATSEHRLGGADFLGGRFDMWNMTMLAPDKSIVPNPLNPKKFVSSMNVFHFMHIQSNALLPEGTELSAKAKEIALKEVANLQATIEACLDTVERHTGRLVVKATNVARLRGLPYTCPAGEPRGPIYMTQWTGVYQFWSWVDSTEGEKFISSVTTLTGGNYESYLFSVCQDFADLM